MGSWTDSLMLRRHGGEQEALWFDQSNSFLYSVVNARRHLLSLTGKECGARELDCTASRMKEGLLIQFEVHVLVNVFDGSGMPSRTRSVASTSVQSFL